MELLINACRYVPMMRRERKSTYLQNRFCEQIFGGRKYAIDFQWRAVFAIWRPSADAGSANRFFCLPTTGVFIQRVAVFRIDTDDRNSAANDVGSAAGGYFTGWTAPCGASTARSGAVVAGISGSGVFAEFSPPECNSNSINIGTHEYPTFSQNDVILEDGDIVPEESRENEYSIRRDHSGSSIRVAL